MAWVAVDRAIKIARNYGSDGPRRSLDGRLRDEIHADVCLHGFNRGAATRFAACVTAATELDASLLMIPLVGFLPPSDPRVAGTTAADRGRSSWKADS